MASLLEPRLPPSTQFQWRLLKEDSPPSLCQDISRTTAALRGHAAGDYADSNHQGRQAAASVPEAVLPS